jgi:hypothetical protein
MQCLPKGSHPFTSTAICYELNVTHKPSALCKVDEKLTVPS